MSGRTHQTYWRTLVSVLPPVGEAYLIGDVLQGGMDEWLSFNMHFGLGCAALLGFWVSRRMMQVLSETPILPIASVKPGFVAVRGRAQALPNTEPLLSPSGEPCVWYYYRQGRRESYFSADSPRPFLLVDDSGQCLIDPVGATFSRVSSGSDEDIIRAGDLLYVAGQLRPFSADKLARTLPPDPIAVSMSFSSEDEAEVKKAVERRFQERIEARKRQPSTISLPALPIVSAPDFGGAFVIVGGGADNESDASWYRLLAGANALAALVSAAMLDYLQWHGLGWTLE